MAETGQGVWHWQQAEQTTLYSVLLNNGDFFIPLESPAEWGIISAFAVPVGDGGWGGGVRREGGGWGGGGVEQVYQPKIAEQSLSKFF